MILQLYIKKSKVEQHTNYKVLISDISTIIIIYVSGKNKKNKCFIFYENKQETLHFYALSLFFIPLVSKVLMLSQRILKLI